MSNPPPVKVCRVCYTYNHIARKNCIDCGHVFKQDTRPDGCYTRTGKICTAAACNYPFCER